MERRKFLKTTGVAGAAGMITIVFPSCTGNAMRNAPDPLALDKSFLTPPDSAKPLTWWHWMNGNISKKGITMDLEAMKNVGVGGFHIIEAGINIPQGPVLFDSPERIEMIKHAASEANRLNLSFTMSNGPGYTSTGGPWITPEMSMQILTWSETKVDGGKLVSTKLKQPIGRLNYYKDALVIAVPAVGDLGNPVKITTKSGNADTSLLIGDPAKGIELSSATPEEPDYLQIEYAAPVEARSISVLNTTIATAQPGMGQGAQTTGNAFNLQSSQDGITYSVVAQLTTSQRSATGFSPLQGLPKEGPFQPSTVNFDAIKAKYFRIVSSQARLISEVSLSGASRIPNWSTKSGFGGARGFGGQNQAATTIVGVAADSPVIPEDGVIDITSFMDDQGQLNWTAPEGNWTVLRIGSTTSGAGNHPPPTGGEGLECDKMNKEVLELHFEQYFGKLYEAIAPLADKGIAGTLIDSFEVGNQNWSSGIPEEFRKRRGYDIKKYFPALFGYVVGNIDTSERFLWDFRKTLAEVMNDYYFKRMAELCHSKKWSLYVEPYDPGNFDEMLSGSVTDIPMGEFWIGRNPHHGLKLAASVGHIYGKKVVGAESFTSTSRWTDFPYAIKSIGDYVFTLGVNRYIYHRYAHQPHPDVAPGMTMGQWGSYWERTNTWYNHSQEWMKYCARCCAVLQQGVFIGDILYFCGEDSPARVLDRASLDPAPPVGYDWDSIDANAIKTRIKIENNQIVFSDGLKYRVLVLNNSKQMTLSLITKIKELVNKGMLLVGSKPVFSPNLSDSDADVKRIADEIWGNLDGTTVKERTFGKGKVFLGMSMQEVLNSINLKRDMEYTASKSDAFVNYIHKSIDDTDVYFVANRRRRTEDVVLSFRVGNKKPELWNPETGEISQAPVFDVIDGRVILPLQFRQSGSVFVVFRNPIPAVNVVEISKDSTTLLAAKPFPVSTQGKYADVTNNFTVSVWVKPEAEGGFVAATGGGGGGFGGSSVFVIQPTTGETVYGAGHVTVGLNAGRAGATVYEQGSGAPVNVLSVPMKLSGWTHFAIVYNAGAPTLYVNGILAGTSPKSGNIVHPESEAPGDQGVYQGHISKVEVIKEALTVTKVRTLVASGIPKPEMLLAVEPAPSDVSKIRYFENGKYSLKDSSGIVSEVTISGLLAPQEITGPWKVSFPPNLGAPAEITMEKLTPFNKYTEDGIKFFSGTASYKKTIDIPADAKANGNRLFLDLGWVEVMADIKLNGKAIGNVWKPPYQLDITDAAITGSNELEVQVTNLWPNRMIGDESLPAEYEYGSAPNFSGAISKIPDWYAKGEPRPKSQRICFSTWRHYTDKTEPLLESGLIGPVLIRTAVEKT